MGGGGKSTTTSSPYSGMLANIGQRMFRTAQPVNEELAAQTGEALRTGGVNAQIPSVNRAMDASREAYSTSYQNTKNQLSEAGLADSQFGQQILASLRTEGGQQIANTPSAVTDQFLSQSVPQVLAQGRAGLGPIETAAQTDYTTTPGFWDFFMQGMSAAGGAGASAGRAAAAH